MRVDMCHMATLCHQLKTMSNRDFPFAEDGEPPRKPMGWWGAIILILVCLLIWRYGLKVAEVVILHFFTSAAS